MRTALTFGALLVLGALLVGCVQNVPAPVPPSPSITPNPSMPAEPVAAAPEPRISLSCEELVPLAEAAEFLGTPVADLRVFDDQDPEFSTAMAQAGALHCGLSGPTLGEDFGVYLSVDVLPDASSEYALVDRYIGDSTAVDTVGQSSVVNCSAYTTAFTCEMRVLSDGYWVEISAGGIGPGGGSAGGSAYAATLAARVTAAGPPGPEFVVPAGSFGVGATCASIDDGGSLRSALDSPTLSAPVDPPSLPMLFVTAVSGRVDRVVCTMQVPDPAKVPAGSVQQISVALTPGGGWNWPEVAADMAENGGAPLSVTGAVRATALSSDDSCAIAAEVHGSLLWLSAIRADDEDPCISATQAVEWVIANV